MIKLAAVAGSLGVFACGHPVVTAPSPAGCPSATQVALAQWNPRVIGSPAYAGGPRDAGWLVRLGFRGGDDPLGPRPGPVPGYEIAKLGLGPLPDTVWLLRPALAPCPARVTGYLAERVDDGPVSVRISAVLAGCAPPGADERWPTAWISFAPTAPTGCALETPVRVGERRGVDPGDGTFTIPPRTDGSDLPAVWELAAPTEPCPDCETLWAIDTVAAEPAISAVTVTDLGPGADACAREAHARFGVYATPKDGAPIAIPLDGALDLVGALVDPRGARVVLAAGVDRWAAHDLAADGVAGDHRTVQYYLAPEEDGPWQSLAPYCGP